MFHFAVPLEMNLIFHKSNLKRNLWTERKLTVHFFTRVLKRTNLRATFLFLSMNFEVHGFGLSRQVSILKILVGSRRNPGEGGKGWGYNKDFLGGILGLTLLGCKGQGIFRGRGHRGKWGIQKELFDNNFVYCIFCG